MNFWMTPSVISATTNPGLLGEWAAHVLSNQPLVRCFSLLASRRFFRGFPAPALPKSGEFTGDRPETFLRTDRSTGGLPTEEPRHHRFDRFDTEDDIALRRSETLRRSASPSATEGSVFFLTSRPKCVILIGYYRWLYLLECNVEGHSIDHCSKKKQYTV